MMDQPLSITPTEAEIASEFARGEWSPSEFARPLLACGHYGKAIYVRSSQWDFPDDVHTCSECGAEVQFHPSLQAALYESWHGPAAG